MKTCKKGIHNYSDELQRCPHCNKIRSKEWVSLNKEKHKNSLKQWRTNNLKTKSEYDKNWHKNNSKDIKFKINQAVKSANRRALKQCASPKWLSNSHIEEIKNMYALAQDLAWLSDEPLQVDHIVPLKSDIVCGLHVPWNLQILPRSKNISKKNIFV